MVSMVKLKFRLGKYPYIYKYSKCNDKYSYSKEKCKAMKETLGLKDEKPVFFECFFHRGTLMKPIGYEGDPSYIMWLPK